MSDVSDNDYEVRSVLEASRNANSTVKLRNLCGSNLCRYVEGT